MQDFHYYFKDWTFPRRADDRDHRDRAKSMTTSPSAIAITSSFPRMVVARYLQFLPLTIALKDARLADYGRRQAHDPRIAKGDAYLYRDRQLSSYFPSALVALTDRGFLTADQLQDTGEEYFLTRFREHLALGAFNTVDTLEVIAKRHGLAWKTVDYEKSIGDQASIPVSVLPVANAAIESFHRAGIRTLGRLCTLPPEMLRRNADTPGTVVGIGPSTTAEIDTALATRQLSLGMISFVPPTDMRLPGLDSRLESLRRTLLPPNH